MEVEGERRRKEQKNKRTEGKNIRQEETLDNPNKSSSEKKTKNRKKRRRSTEDLPGCVISEGNRGRKG